MKMPTSAMNTFPLEMQTPMIASTTAIETSDSMTSEPFQSSLNGAQPRNTRPPIVAAITNASIDARPSFAQYTSSRWSHSANSSIVSPAPTPNPAASSSTHGLPGSATNSRKPV